MVDATVLAAVVKTSEKMTEFRMVELEIMGSEAFRLCALRKNLEPMLGLGAFASSQDAGCVNFRPRESRGCLGGHCTAPEE